MNDQQVTILAIESSCDDTAAAVLVNGRILSNIVANQSVHQQYGGVVPELASRAHQQHIIPVVDAALKKAQINKDDLSAIAFTRGPGLLGSLLVGSSFAKGMALALDKPLIEVNHMQGHVLAHFIKDEDNPSPEFPFLCLVVSGGHTQILMVKDHLDMEIIGETNDDAAGEAFDKVAKLLELPYPGGPLIDKLAAEGNPLKFKFPEPQMADLNFSFSGLKTSILYFLRDQQKQNKNFIAENLNDICASVQHTIVSILIKKVAKAVETTGVKTVAVAGGVSANTGLRKALIEFGKQKSCGIFIPKFEFCTDNAAMIAAAAYYKYLKKDFCSITVTPLPRYSF